MDNSSVVKRSILQLQRDYGNVFPIEEIVRSNPEVTKEDILKALDDLTSKGIVSMLDDETIQVNT